MPTVSQAFRRFLASVQNQLPGADLIARYLQYGPENLETQVNTCSDDGDPVEGRRHTWTDGESTWFSIRIPKNAMLTPEWEDYELHWAPEEHADAIGSTGWDWKKLRSRWVGFDVDDLISHAKGIGVTDEEMARIKEVVQQLPYVEARRSTRGGGLHLYVLFDDEGVPTANHTEHAALARCILGMMTAEVGFDFAAAVDCCGGNMWIWSRRTTVENRGLELIKPATKRLSVTDLPSNWRDHIAVVTRQATKIKLQGVTGDTLSPFDELTASRRLVPLDEKHKLAIELLMDTGFSTIWVPDHHLLQTHTKALEKIANDAQSRSKLGFVGHFQTNSPGKNPGEPNCFLFPTLNGGWRVYRFSLGIAEAETWAQDGAGWTTCYFNRLPDLDTACRAYGGLPTEGKPNYMFPDSESAVKAALALGQKLDIPDDLKGRPVELRVHNGFLITYLKKSKDDPETIKGWNLKKGQWIQDSKKKLTPDDKSDLGDNDYDNVVRSLRSLNGEIIGWTYQSTQGDWNETNAGTIKMILQGKGQAKTEAEVIMGKCAVHPWQIMCLPFADEFPGGRRWNRQAPQLKYKPALTEDETQAAHPHWDLILNHVGTELTPALKDSHWAQKYGILTGGQYLLLWIAAAFREPLQRTPYLFLHGNENCGKSIFYESIALLVTKGVVSANKALTTPGDFNGELAGAVFCYVEEIDLSHHKVALPRIKEYVMAETLPIRQMRMDLYHQPNTTHWMHMANFLEYCPIFRGDSRITAIRVPDLLKEQEIPKGQFLELLKKEAPQFLHTIFNVSIPPSPSRLRVPIIETQSKLAAIEHNQTFLEEFIATYCKEEQGARTPLPVFYEAFRKWLPDDSIRAEWTLPRICSCIKGTTLSRCKSQRYLDNLVLCYPKEEEKQ